MRWNLIFVFHSDVWATARQDLTLTWPLLDPQRLFGDLTRSYMQFYFRYFLNSSVTVIALSLFLA
jgi:hypothetical protein